MSRKLSIIFVCALCMVGGIANAADLNWNGNFNTGNFDGWWSWAPNPAAQTITIDLVGGPDSSSCAVIWNADTTSAGNAQLGTNWFSVTAGITYNASLAFNEAAVAGGGWAGVTAGLEFFDSGGAWISGNYPNLWDTGGSWTTYNFATIAPAGAVNAQFKLDSWAGGGGAVTAYIDNVSITPEPATMVLLGIGGLVALRRKHA